MKNRELAEKWLERAGGNLARARLGKTSRAIFYEDLCFDAQQAAEKSLKALLISLDVEFPWTHSIDVLIKLLRNAGLAVPKHVEKAASLTDYGIKFRYPGEEEPVTEEDYRDALLLAETVFQWAGKIMEEEKS